MNCRILDSKKQAPETGGTIFKEPGKTNQGSLRSTAEDLRHEFAGDGLTSWYAAEIRPLGTAYEVQKGSRSKNMYEVFNDYSAEDLDNRAFCVERSQVSP